jgi:hypothetical protein
MASAPQAVSERPSSLPECVERFRSFTMAHPRLLQAKDDLLDAIEGSPPGSLVLVLGPTGVGKTTLRRKVEESLTQRMAPCMETDLGRIPFVSVEAVAPDNGNFHWRDHFQRMLVHMQEPLIEHKLNIGCSERARNGQFVGCPREATGYQLQQSIENALRHRRPAAVFVDEAQHLARMASGRKLADQLDVIKSVANRTQTVHVLLGTYELLAFRNLSGQLSRRSVDLHFSRYCAESSDDIEIFQNVVLTFQGQLPLGHGLNLPSIWDFLYERSVGCVGVLKDWLMRALIATIRGHSTSLTRRVLDKTALSVSQCEKILAEAREGELRLTENSDTQNRLRRLLNLNDDQVSTPMQDSHSAPCPSPVKKGKPGLRQPKRDPIGHTEGTHA